MRKVAVILFLSFVATALWGQADRGSISGTVVDPTGKVMSGVRVSIVDSATGVGYSGSATDSDGTYRIIALPIGSYSLTFEKPGFKQYDRKGITVSVAQDAKVNVTLQVGAVTETVTVTSNAELLDTSSATVATTVESGVIEELPLSINGGRNALGFANMAVPTVGGGLVANSQSVSSNIMVDGVDADAALQGQQAPPGVEAVEQIQVQTSGIDAESSQTGGGTFQYELKSGTDKLHGSVFYFLTNEAFDANNWANKYWLAFCSTAGAGSSAQCPNDYGQQYRRPTDRLKDWGFSGGGPIWKRHTFIFGDYERFNASTMAWSANGTTVPTTQMLTGDFSQLLTYSGIPNSHPGCTAGVACSTGMVDAAGNTIYWGAIFDPSHPGQVFPGNIIPSGRISPQSQNVIKIYQQDYAPLNNNLTNNYWGFGGNTNTVQNLDLKLDQNFSEKNHASASANLAQSEITQLGNHSGGSLWQKGSLTGGPFADSQRSPFKYMVVHLGDSYAFKSNLMNNFIFAFNWANKDDVTAAPAGSDFPGSTSSLFPNISFGGSNGIYPSTIGQDFDTSIRWQELRTKDTVSFVRGRHVLKFGAELTSYNALGGTAGGMSWYTVSNILGMPQSIANNSTQSGGLGSGLANMMLGDISSASSSVYGPNHTTRRAFDAFASDQIKVTNKITLNASLRWDVDGRLHERNGNWSNWNTTAQNSSWPGLLGAFTYLANPSQSFETDEDYRLFSPHVGVAYQLTSKLVIRGAWGIFYVPLGNNTYGGIPYSTDSGSCVQCFGSNQTAPQTSNVTPGFQWDKTVYPGVASPAQKNSNGNFGGDQVYLTPDELRLGHTQNWNLGIQYALDKNTVVDIHYMGNSASSLHDGSLYPQRYPTWSQYQPLVKSGHAGDWITSAAGAQAAGVPWYPFLLQTIGGWGGYNAEPAISPFPQATASGKFLVAGFPQGSAGFNGLVTEVKRRAGGSLSMDLSYTFSKAVQNTANYMNTVNGGNMTDGWIYNDIYQDPYSYGSFKNLISPNDIRHLVKGYAAYNLPFGRNGRWLVKSRSLDYLVGGWTLTPVVYYQSGAPMPAQYATNSYPGWPNTWVNVSTAAHALSNHFKKLDLYNLSDPSNQFFNPASFTDQTLTTSDPLYGTLGNQKPFYSDWRGWASYNENLGILKHFSFGPNSRFKAIIHADFFNVLNRHQWSTPGSNDPGNAFFGDVTGVSGNRTGQISAKFTW